MSCLVPRLRSIGLMEFNRAHEAIAEGRACVEAGPAGAAALPLVIAGSAPLRAE